MGGINARLGCSTSTWTHPCPDLAGCGDGTRLHTHIIPSLESVHQSGFWQIGHGSRFETLCQLLTSTRLSLAAKGLADILQERIGEPFHGLGCRKVAFCVELTDCWDACERYLTVRIGLAPVADENNKRFPLRNLHVIPHPSDAVVHLPAFALEIGNALRKHRGQCAASSGLTEIEAFFSK